MGIFYRFLGIDYDMTIYPARRAKQQNGYIGLLVELTCSMCNMIFVQSWLGTANTHGRVAVGKSPSSNVAVDCPECHGGDYHSATGYPAW